MADSEIQFVDGLIVKAPHPKAPDFVKASISINVESLGKWLREQYKAGNKEWINLDVKESKGGKWYAAVSTFKPKQRNEEAREASSTYRPKPAQDSDDIPFAPIGKVEASAL